MVISTLKRFHDGYPNQPSPFSMSTEHLHEGQRFFCNHCHQESIVSVKRIMDGFKVTGEVLVCAFCKSPIPVSNSEPSDAQGVTNKKSSSGLDKLSNLFNMSGKDTEDALQVTQLQEDKSKMRFCRDCRYYIKHPFFSRCQLKNQDVEPMDDCEQFQRAATK